MTDTTQICKPEVSVIMAVYNGGDYLRLAIESVLRQSFKSFEFVIIDDGSTDGSTEVIQSFDEPRIVYTQNAENCGQTKSLNVGLKLARADLIARIDADDLWYPGKLREQFDFMAGRPDVALCGTWADRIDAAGDIMGSFSPPTKAIDIRFRALWASPLCHVSVMMRRDVILENGGYPSKYQYAADHELWSLLLRGGHKLANLPIRLTQFREMAQTSGMANKVGPAGDESAKIIQSNALALNRIKFDLGQCRDIALLFFPEAGLSPGELAKAYKNLELLAKANYNFIPIRIRLELLAVLFWSFLKRTEHLRSRDRGHSTLKVFRETIKIFRRRPIALVSATGAVIMAGSGGRIRTRIKSRVITWIAWLRRLTSQRG